METRREFMTTLAVAAPGALLIQEKKKEQEAEDVAPPEDLMREHGVLNRILLIYDGFEHMVDRVAGLENRLGVYDLAQFTPR